MTVRKSKTDAGVRVIPLLEEAQVIIEQQPRWEKHIFLNTKGNPLSATSMNKLYMHLRKLTGIQMLTNHVCRHNFATRMLEHDADIKSISKILGRTDVAFTLQRYTTMDLDHLRREIQKLKK
ncbi:MAG: tyrosine-type recombinase/integrase [Dorea sp.]|nr:tyrosine-type recombinase/integrase [Dorea sp.]